MLLPEKLMDFKYYRQKLPLYLQNSEGFVEHFKIWYDLLVGQQDEKTGVVGSLESVLSKINIFSDDFVNDSSDMLDKLGALFGVSRRLVVTYQNNGTSTTEELNLDNDDFLYLIKAQIIRNYSDGTYAQANEYYNNAKLFVLTKNDDTPGRVRIYLNDISDSSYSYSDNVKKMFLSGLLNIKHLGIQYLYSIQNLRQILIWDNADSEITWDGGQWAI